MDNRFTYKPAIPFETSREKDGGRFVKISGYGSHVLFLCYCLLIQENKTVKYLEIPGLFTPPRNNLCYNTLRLYNILRSSSIQDTFHVCMPFGRFFCTLM